MKAARGVKFQPVSSRSSARDSQYIRSGAKCQPVSRPSGSAKGFRPRSRQTDGRCQTTSCPTSSAKGFRPQYRHTNGRCQPLSRPTSSAKGFRPRSRFTRRAMSTEDNSNGNLCGAVTGGTGSTTSTPGPGLLKPTSSSTEDLSEYTDADESISAPTEFLAEFLSAVMLKDYETALKYCKLILQYEPNNVTAKEFYPLILEKLQNTYNNSSSRHYPTPSSSSSSPSPSPGSSSSSASSSSSDEEGDGDVDDGPDGDDVDGDPEEDEEEENSGKRSSDGDATTASYSSLEDEEVDRKERVDNVDIGNGNHIIRDSRGAAWEVKGMSSSGPVTVPFGTSSDSESPTEPVSQQTIAMLRAKVIPPRH